MTPEWIVLTDRETRLPRHFAASQITYGPRAPTFDRGCDVWASGAVFHVLETEAQIMVLLGMWPREPQPANEPSEAEIEAASERDRLYVEAVINEAAGFGDPDTLNRCRESLIKYIAAVRNEPSEPSEAEIEAALAVLDQMGWRPGADHETVVAALTAAAKVRTGR